MYRHKLCPSTTIAHHTTPESIGCLTVSLPWWCRGLLNGDLRQREEQEAREHEEKVERDKRLADKAASLKAKAKGKAKGKGKGKGKPRAKAAAAAAVAEPVAEPVATTPPEKDAAGGKEESTRFSNSGLTHGDLCRSM